jgi:hypothetical protein
VAFNLSKSKILQVLTDALKDAVVAGEVADKLETAAPASTPEVHTATLDLGADGTVSVKLTKIGDIVHGFCEPIFLTVAGTPTSYSTDAFPVAFRPAASVAFTIPASVDTGQTTLVGKLAAGGPPGFKLQIYRDYNQEAFTTGHVVETNAFAFSYPTASIA